MGRSRSASWIAGAVILALLILAGAWLLLISPTLTEAADTQSRAEAEQVRADQLEIQLAALRRDYEDIDELKAELETLRVSVPTESHLSELTRQVDAIAASAGVFIVGAQSVSPALIASPQAATDTETTTGTEGEATDEQPTDTTGTADATAEQDAAAAPTSGLYAVGVDWTVLGDFSTTLTFIERLQAENPRLVVVTGLQATTQQPAGAQSGKPEIIPGYIETIVRTYVYVYPDDGQVPTSDGDEDEVRPEPTMPVPTVPRNPFLQNP